MMADITDGTFSATAAARQAGCRAVGAARLAQDVGHSSVPTVAVLRGDIGP